MDAVITYVNGLDPLWQKDYEQALNVPALSKRFRDWGTLKYLLRGIRKNMPFIENVYLVVARGSQVPEWVNMERLKVVMHSDFVPSAVLPTFNCNPLELNLHRIPGIAEQFLYLNDDMFPIAPCSPEDFYVDGKGAIGFSTCMVASGSYKKITRNSYRLALKALGKKPGILFKRPQHTCSPMLKSVCEEVYGKVGKDIETSYTKIRTAENFNQYLFLDYMLLTDRAIARRLPAKFFSLATSSAAKIADFLSNPTTKLICINDVHLSESKYETYRTRLLEAFEQKFPEKSEFEL